MGSKLAAVIVNYRSADLTIACLRSLAPEVGSLPAARAVVVENGSGDASEIRIRSAIEKEGWGSWASLLPLGSNRGFSAGNNAALRLLLTDPTPPDWFLLLNPDTVVRSGALRALLDRAERTPRAGIVGARLLNPDGTAQGCAFRFHSIATEVDSALSLGVVSRLLRRHALVMGPMQAAHRVDWVTGAAMMIRREVFDEIGLLDDGYFLYYEEVDFCRRAARVGWECWHEPASEIVHLNGASTGVDFVARRLPDYVLESRRRYFVKNHGRAYAAGVDALWIAAHLAWRVRMFAQRRRVDVPAGFLRRFLAHSALMNRDRR